MQVTDALKSPLAQGVTEPGAVAEADPVWGTFQDCRDHLSTQFQETPFVEETGLSPEELAREVQAYLEANANQPRVLQKANVFRIAVTRAQICVDPFDWFADKLNHGDVVRKLSRRWLDEAKLGPLAEESAWFAQAGRIGLAHAPEAGLDRGHIAPGWERMLSAGLTGLLGEAARARAALGASATEKQLAFYEAVEIVYRATIEFAGRISRLADEMAEEDPAQATRLRAVASACQRVPAQAPQSFHQALQFVWLMHELIEMEGELVRSMGQFDRTLYPYYRADIDAGCLTREQAKELIKFFWFKWYSRTGGRVNGKNFVFGGQHPDGSEITNELTYLALEAYEELNTPDPKLSVRFLPGTPDRLYNRVADLIRKGHNSFVLMNDDPAVEALVKRGKTVEDARMYLPIGCYEPAVEGKEVGCTMNVTINLAKGVELALNDGVDPLSGVQVGARTGDPTDFANFAQLFDAYAKQTEFIISRSAECIRAAEGQWPQINPSPLIAATIADCLPRGKDIGEGGAHYNSVGFVGAGLANACDSLLALQQAVYEDRRFGIQEVLEALRCDFDGCEAMRQYLLNRIPKWGNNDPEADHLAKRIADHYCGEVHELRNGRGGPCQAALFTLTFAQSGGAATGATPDGRRAGEALAPGVGSTAGPDRKGVTALMESVAKLDFTATPNGSVLDVMLHPTAVAGQEGLAALVALIRTFFSKGGYALQFNVFDVETLRDAQRHPERYASMQIRVTGWSVYFTTLSKQEQEQFIVRNAHGVTDPIRLPS